MHSSCVCRLVTGARSAGGRGDDLRHGLGGGSRGASAALGRCPGPRALRGGGPALLPALGDAVQRVLWVVVEQAAEYVRLGQPKHVRAAVRGTHHSLGCAPPATKKKASKRKKKEEERRKKKKLNKKIHKNNRCVQSPPLPASSSSSSSPLSRCSLPTLLNDLVRHVLRDRYLQSRRNVRVKKARH